MARLPFLALALAMAGAAAAQPMEGEPPEEPSSEEREEEPEESSMKPPAALPDRPVMLRVGGSVSRDSNIFRAPDARAENIGTAYVGVTVDKSYAQQRIRLDVTETAYRYDNFSHLDFEGLNYLGAWEWRLTPRISGALRASREESLADYSEFRRPGERNVRTTENFGLTADAWLFGGWHVTGGLSRVQNRYSVPFPEEGSYQAGVSEAGVKYVSPAANSLAFTLRTLDGRYTDRPLDPVALLDDGFRRTEAEALASWRLTGKSSLDGRLAHVDYRSNHFTERDFSGVAARLRYAWTTTPRFSLNVQYGRELEPWADASASYRVEDRLTLGPVWQPAARTTLRLDATRAESDFRNPVPGFAGPERRDVQHSLQLEAEWRALRNLSLKAAVQRYRQSSNDPAANFSGSQLTAGASLLF